MAFFTVIIPLYNKESYVENTINSILNQTFTNYEVLIVNDCSTDDSVAKVKPFLSEKIKLIAHSENKGLSATRNTGIQNANANYITFLDADDLWVAGRFGLQCLRNLDQLPPTGAMIVAAPLKIQEGSGSPLRVLALL